MVQKKGVVNSKQEKREKKKNNKRKPKRIRPM